MGVDECRVDYVQLRKWVGDVNLFEKDFVFIPVIASSHWSLLVVCHLRSLNPSSSGGRRVLPCILHLDPFKGEHDPCEGQVKSFILQAWAERFGASHNLSHNVDVSHSLFQMKYVHAKVPLQDNGYDCGLYILHYIEVFLLKSASQDLIVSSLEGDVHFFPPKFKKEDVFGKRKHIIDLISGLRGEFQVDNGSHLSVEAMPEEVGLVHSLKRRPGGSLKGVKETKSKKWKEAETSILLQCVVDGDIFSKGKLGAVHWDLVAEKINKENSGGPLRSKEQCQNRFDVLLKAYKALSDFCWKEKKEFCNVTEDEKRLLKLATPLRKQDEEWYNHLHTIYCRRSDLRGQSHKRLKPNLDGDIDVNQLVSSPVHPSRQCPPSLDQPRRLAPTEPSSSRHIIVQEFNKLTVKLRFTFLNSIQLLALGVWYYDSWSLEAFCRVLAIVQDENLFEIRNHVYDLQHRKLVLHRKLVTFYNEEGEEDEGRWLDMKSVGVPDEDEEVYKKIVKKVLSKNPHLNIFCKFSGSVLATKSYASQHIRVLILHGCQELESFDLCDLRALRCFTIGACAKLKVVTGWEVTQKLGWIKIFECPSYCNLPNVQFLPSLKEVVFSNLGVEGSSWQWVDFSQCAELYKLEVHSQEDMVESMDLKALRVLEVLSYDYCSTLTTIHGLNGLQSLKKFHVFECCSLKRLPDLGCLKVLTHLDMRWSGIIDISGVAELHRLIMLDLNGCQSLKVLPSLGHLKALAYLKLMCTNIEDIPGVEGLVSLETLICSGSNLSRLPNLDHLPHLHEVCVEETPLSIVDPSYSFFTNGSAAKGRKEQWKFVDEISDITDSNATSSDED